MSSKAGTKVSLQTRSYTQLPRTDVNTLHATWFLCGRSTISYREYDHDRTKLSLKGCGDNILEPVIKEYWIRCSQIFRLRRDFALTDSKARTRQNVWYLIVTNREIEICSGKWKAREQFPFTLCIYYIYYRKGMEKDSLYSYYDTNVYFNKEFQRTKSREHA